MKRRIRFALLAPLLLALPLLSAPAPAFAAFHLMQIDQVIGGVGGDTTAQAVQLRMRTTLQNQLSGDAQLVVRDGNGADPRVLSTFPMPNPTQGTCLAILLATDSFTAKTSPAAVPNYTMMPIPASFLAKGTLTFETLGGATTYWRVSWGGFDPNGVMSGVAGGFNDDNTTTAPSTSVALPSTSAQALAFTPPCGTTSTTSAAQYAVTASAAVFTNNAGATFTVQQPPPVPGLPGRSHWLLPGLLGAGVLAFAVIRRRGKITA
ncbi:MAG TPA: hypothetical protein VEI82_05455 [Myxococcota bacterium]|nr:hypothetical protein [Myxococcota bacterium]